MQRNLPHQFEIGEQKPVKTVGVGFGPVDG